MIYHFCKSNDKQKQFIQEKIDYHLTTLANDIVELVQQTDELWFENLRNRETYRCGTCGEAARYREGEVLQQCHCGLAEDEDPEWASPDELDMEPEQQEILQWFLLSDDWIADKLASIGEPVLTWGSRHFWGRTCYGQSVFLDPTFWNIYQKVVKKYANES